MYKTSWYVLRQDCMQLALVPRVRRVCTVHLACRCPCNQQLPGSGGAGSLVRHIVSSQSLDTAPSFWPCACARQVLAPCCCSPQAAQLLLPSTRTVMVGCTVDSGKGLPSTVWGSTATPAEPSMQGSGSATRRPGEGSIHLPRWISCALSANSLWSIFGIQASGTIQAVLQSCSPLQRLAWHLHKDINLYKMAS